jgi:hypothetical protein
VLLVIGCVTLSDCRPAGGEPVIEFTRIPVAAAGGADKFESIAGRAVGAKPGQRVVLYAKSGVWWVQPRTNTPFTDIRPDSGWQALIHRGTEYAALLVDPAYRPDATMQVLPAKGGAIAAVASTRGTGSYTPEPPKIFTIHFSGYDWDVRQGPSSRGGKDNPYEPENVSIDDHGFLHLRVTRKANQWVCSEVRLKRSLGQGTYFFTVQDLSNLDPAAVMTLYTWDDFAPEKHHREVDVEISRWGDPKKKNAQYVVQPYYEPANVFRFDVPAGPVTFSFHWVPGEVAFKTARGSGIAGVTDPISAHTFTSGVPSPGGEAVQLNLYAFGNTLIPMRSEAEVIIEKFQFLP